ncbi:acyl-CoA synthetase [Ramlibacter henchirensis]|uniref:Acyl-CoA synthetase n=1 Tax=Ramlibacter henchirensis TaxID=204072 RepID=A0A4Z0C768_9BURK|nr:acyl-CoA synthetase [Ramlibacter henchirensis]TFZ05925.1 acyl-CoA synthetase [Ramlibacter henchirensis]
MKIDINLAGGLDTIEAVESHPWRHEIPATDTYGMLAAAERAYGERTALRFIMGGEPDAPDFSWTYRQLLQQVTCTANAFHASGANPASPVSILLPNLPETHFALWGAQAASVASPINPLLDIEHIEALVRATGSQTLVTLGPLPGSELWDKAVALVERTGSIKTVYVVDPRRYLPPAMQPAVAAFRAAAPAIRRAGVQSLDFHDAIAGQPASRLVSARAIRETDACAYFHTGGTTGAPKVAVHTHLNETFTAWACTVANRSVQPGDVTLCGLPLFHVNGAIVTGLAAFHRGMEVVMLTPQGYRGPGVILNFWKFVERFKARSFSGVPTLYASLLEVPIAGVRIDSLRHGLCGAAPMPRELVERFERLTGVVITEGYGLTEGGCVSSSNPLDGLRKPGSVGVRIPFQQIRIVRVDGEGRWTGDCAAGETGVVALRGPNIFPGYLGSTHNEGLWVEPGWINSGDLGHLDEDGYLFITGRAKDLIIRGGHNLDPALIEAGLASHPAVALAAAVGQPDARVGELPVAFVSLRPGCTATAEELMDHARATVPERAAVPVRIEVLEFLPTTAVGKLSKLALRLRAVDHVYAGVLASAGVPGSVASRHDARRGIVAAVSCAPEARALLQERFATFPVPVEFVA